MSISVSSRIILGVKIDYTLLMEKTKIEVCDNCGCDLKNIENVHFCFKCGKEFKTTKFIDIFDYDNVNGIPIYGIMYGYDQLIQYFCKTYIIGFELTLDLSQEDFCLRRISINKFSEEKIKKQKQKIFEALEPYNLWNEDNFGIWHTLTII